MSNHIKSVYNTYKFKNTVPYKGFNLTDKREFTNCDAIEGGLYEGYVNSITLQRDGQGLVIWNDNSIYDGWWYNDQPHGKGIKVFSNGDCYYGEFRHGKMTGKGSYHKEDDSKYEGEWLDNLQHGEGTQTWIDQHSYTGQWSKGK